MNTSLKDLSIALNYHGRHGLLSFLSSLSPLTILSRDSQACQFYLIKNKRLIKFYNLATKLYKAALLTI